MKKSLIVSVIMTLVLVIAMSTATYAWYTSNTSVNATATTIGTAKASDANIEFRWYNDGDDTILYNGTTISFTGLGNDNGLKPMVPNKKYTSADTAINFVTAPITLSNTFATNSSTGTPWTQTYTGGARVFNPVEGGNSQLDGTNAAWASVVAPAVSGFTTSDGGTWWAQNYTRFYRRTGESAPYTYTKLQWSETTPGYAAGVYYDLDASAGDDYGITGTVTHLKIGNTATSPTGAIKVTGVVSNGNSSALNDALRIAIFTKGYSRTGEVGSYTYTPDSTPFYRGVLAQGASVISFATNPTWTAGTTVASAITQSSEEDTGWVATAINSGFEVGYINGEANMEIYIYAWYDGSILNNALSGNSASFALTFAIV